MCQEKAEVKGKHGGKTLGKNVSATGQTLKQRLSATVLADDELQFALTLETMALKKQKTKKSS